MAKTLLAALLATTLGIATGCERDSTDRIGEDAGTPTGQGAPTQGARPGAQGGPLSGAGAGTTSTTMR
jgi:hypothetical protein